MMIHGGSNIKESSGFQETNLFKKQKCLDKPANG